MKSHGEIVIKVEDLSITWNVRPWRKRSIPHDSRPTPQTGANPHDAQSTSFMAQEKSLQPAESFE